MSVYCHPDTVAGCNTVSTVMASSQTSQKDMRASEGNKGYRKVQGVDLNDEYPGNLGVKLDC